MKNAQTPTRPLHGPAPVVSQAVTVAVSPELGSIKVEPSLAALAPQTGLDKPLPRPQDEKPDPNSDYVDTVVQENYPAPSLLTVFRSFNGLSANDDQTVLGGVVAPPDTDGAVGPNHYVQMVNLVFAVYDKNGNVIERLYAAGITTGCGGGNYCPGDSVTRAQMAVFLERGMHGSSFTPLDVLPTFGDTAGHWAEDWIEALRSDGITTGCGGGNYCPEDNVTRAQMAVFLLRAKHGASYIPPDATPTFGDTAGHWAEDWIEQLYVEGITSGCGGGNYCPEDDVNRAEMAVFLVRTFNLP